MSQEPQAGPGQEVVHATQHFQVRVGENGQGVLEMLGTDDMVVGRHIPGEYAGIFAEVAEHGYHRGAKDLKRLLEQRFVNSVDELLGPITYPRGVVRETKEE